MNQRMYYSGVDVQGLLLVLQWAFGKLFNVDPKDWVHLGEHILISAPVNGVSITDTGGALRFAEESNRMKEKFELGTPEMLSARLRMSVPISVLEIQGRIEVIVTSYVTGVDIQIICPTENLRIKNEPMTVVAEDGSINLYFKK